jgi:hypothetical protein
MLLLLLKIKLFSSGNCLLRWNSFVLVWTFAPKDERPTHHCIAITEQGSKLLCAWVLTVHDRIWQHCFHSPDDFGRCGRSLAKKSLNVYVHSRLNFKTYLNTSLNTWSTPILKHPLPVHRVLDWMVTHQHLHQDPITAQQVLSYHLLLKGSAFVSSSLVSVTF